MKYILLLIFVVLMGCASITKYTDVSYPPKDANAEIEVFRLNKPDKPYIEIGEIRTRYMEGMKYEARRMGADAIIIIGASKRHYSGYQDESGIGFASSSERGIHAIAIKYK